MSYGEKKKEKENLQRFLSQDEEEREGKDCPQCREANELEASFCAECAYDFSGARKCSKCKATVSAQADICETCGEWLLEGKCKFCNSDIEEGEAYCGECGNPVDGIACSQCGQLSYFDFCKHCSIPLTETAKKMLENIKNDPTEQKLLSLDISTISEEEISESKELNQMKAYREKVDKQESIKKRVVPKSIFSERHRDSLKKIGRDTDLEIKRRKEEKRKEEEERRRKAEEERKRREEEKKRKEEERQQLQALLDEIKKKIFSTNQDARRYFMSHKPKNTRGWLCNAYDATHDSPCDCAAPEQGGVWLI